MSIGLVETSDRQSLEFAGSNVENCGCERLKTGPVPTAIITPSRDTMPIKDKDLSDLCNKVGRQDLRKVVESYAVPFETPSIWPSIERSDTPSSHTVILPVQGELPVNTIVPSANVVPPLGQGGSHERIPAAIPLMALAEAQPEHERTLLGDRYLCVGGSMLFVGPSGIGKSSAGVQQDILWALGRPAFGITPARPLRLLCVQAENDAGDLGEMARGICCGLKISAEDQHAIRDRIYYVTEKSCVGSGFLKKVVEPLLEQYHPDILRIDPLLAYLGADINDATATAAFLRTGLNPLLDRFNCGAIICHHTPKVTNRDTSQWRTSDWMYAGAGSADLTNWCRAALVIDPTHSGDVFRFIAAKRGGRIGWRNEAGERIYERYFSHATNGGIYWQETTPDVAETAMKTGGKAAKSKEDLLALVPQEGSIPKNVLLSEAQGHGIGEKRARGLLEELLNTGELHESRVPRPRTNPVIHISRHEQHPA